MSKEQHKCAQSACCKFNWTHFQPNKKIHDNDNDNNIKASDIMALNYNNFKTSRLSIRSKTENFLSDRMNQQMNRI